MIVYSVLRLRRYFVFTDPVQLRKLYRATRQEHSRNMTRYILTAGLMPAAQPI